MRNPLNDCETFAAMCGGAGFAFGVAACLTIGTELTERFAVLSVVSLVMSAIIYSVSRLSDKLTDAKKSNSSDANQTEFDK